MSESFERLQSAIQAQELDTCKQILDSSPLLSEACDAAQQTGLHHAAFSGAREIASLLLERGADIGARTVVGYTPLHYAAFAGQEAVFEQLLEAGADIHALDDSQTTVLHAASVGGNMDIVQQALDAGIEPGALNLYEESPLHRAAQRNQLAVIQRLIDQGADPRPIDRYDLGLLHKAAIGGAEEVAAWLLDQGHDPEAKNTPGETPLHTAAEMGRENTVRLLIERGANVNCQTLERSTPLHAAAASGQVAMVEQLLEAGAESTARDDLGRTPLHVAAIRGHADSFPALIGAGISPTLEDAAGHRPIDLAMAYGRTAAIQALRNQSKDKPVFDTRDVRALATRTVAPGEMMVWYLGHSGWALRTTNHWIVLDYAPGAPHADEDSLVNGRIRIEELSGTPITVMVTHHHQDHFDPRILGWKDSADIRYVFGWTDTLDLPDTRVAGRETVEIDGLRVHAIPATDAGSAFLIEVDGLRIFHAGDHTSAEIPPETAFTEGLEWLAEGNAPVDAAFLPVFGCGLPETEELRAGNRYAIETLSAKTVFPMHIGWTGYFYRRFARWAKEVGIEASLGIADQPGDRFLVRRGTIKRIWS